MEDILQVREEYRLQQWGQIVQQCRESGMSNRDFAVKTESQRKRTITGCGNCAWQQPAKIRPG